MLFSMGRCCTLLLALAMSLPSATPASHTARQLQTQTLDLYTLKPFAVSITSSAIQNADSLPLESIGYALKTVTEKYLKQFFDGSIMHQDSPLQAVHSVDLKVSVRRSSQRRHLQEGLWAEMYGEAAFLDTETPPSRDEAESFLATLIEGAFSGPLLDVYKQRIEASGEFHLQNIVDIKVTTNLDDATPTLVAQAGDGADSGGLSPLGSSLLAVMLLFICISSVFFYHRVVKQRNKKTLYPQQDGHDFYGSHNLACMAERGMHPSNKEHDRRSYSTRTFPLEAAWATLTNSTRNLTLTQQEPFQEDDRDVVDHHIHRSGPYTPQEGGSLASWVRSLSSSFQTKKEEEEIQFMTCGENGKSFIYKDFPRHDGTPCLIYNPDHLSPRERANSSNRVRANSSIWASTSPVSEDIVAPEEEDVDSFVDRLEQLMVLRHEQYLERCSAEWERERRRKRTYSRDGPVITVEEAEAVLDDFLDIDAAVVTPIHSPAMESQKIYHSQVLSDEKRIDEAMRAQMVDWDEEDPTISGIMT